MTPLAVTFTVSGLHGWLLLIAVIAFAVAAVAAWVAPSHRPAVALIAAGLIAAGLCLATLSLLVSG